MIEDLTIRRFRGIEELELHGLGRLNLVIGPNGAAKTTLLQAVFALCLDSNSEGLAHIAKPENDASEESFVRAFQWLIHRSERDLAKSSIAEFHAQTERGSRDVRLSLTEPKLRQLGPLTGVPTTGRDQTPPGGPSALGPELDALISSALLVATLDSRQSGEPDRVARVGVLPARGVVVQQDDAPSRIQALLLTASQDSGFVHDGVPRLISRAEASGRLGDAVEFLRNFDPNIEALRVGVGAKNQPLARVVHRRLGVVPMAVLGDGFVAAAATVLGVLGSEVRVALLDEFDSRLHVGIVHRMFPMLLQVARDRNIQIFLTSHRHDSVEALAALEPQSLAEARVIQMSRFENVIRGRVIGGDAVQRLTGELGLDLRQPA